MFGVVLAAGAGSRMGYLGGILPKTMVPVRGRPLLWYALRSLADLGSTEAVVVVRRENALTRSYVEGLLPRQVGLRRVGVVSLPRPTPSPIDTLVRGVGSRGSDTLAVAFGDDLTWASNLRPLASRFLRSRAVVGQAVTRESDPEVLRRTCEVRLSPQGWIEEIHEKPKRPQWSWRGCGLYLFQGEELPRLLRAARAPGATSSLTDLVAQGASEGKALGLPLEGTNVNVNTVEDVVRAWTLAPADAKLPL